MYILIYRGRDCKCSNKIIKIKFTTLIWWLFRTNPSVEPWKYEHLDLISSTILKFEVIVAVLLLYFSASLDELYAFQYQSPDNIPKSQGWDMYEVSAEYMRMGLPNEHWTQRRINRDYEASQGGLCTWTWYVYPQKMIRFEYWMVGILNHLIYVHSITTDVVIKSLIINMCRNLIYGYIVD